MTVFQKLSWLMQMGIHHLCDEKPHSLAQKNKTTGSTKTLQELDQQIAQITNSLSVTATHTIGGIGIVPAKVLCVLEAPSANEDRTGIPLSGEEGELLKKMLKAIQLDVQSQTYVTYFSPWRAPGARVLTPIETKECFSLFKKRISLVQPQLILVFGTSVVKALTGGTLGQIRSKPATLQGIRIFATFAPSFLIKNPNYKKQAWVDLQKVQQALNKE